MIKAPRVFRVAWTDEYGGYVTDAQGEWTGECGEDDGDPILLGAGDLQHLAEKLERYVQRHLDAPGPSRFKFPWGGQLAQETGTVDYTCDVRPMIEMKSGKLQPMDLKGCRIELFLTVRVKGDKR